MATNKFKNNLLTYAKLILAAGLVALIIYKVDITASIQYLKEMNWWYFLLAISLQWIIILIGTHRLQILLRAQDLNLTFGATLKYNCIGYFFNWFSLGATGGDMVKAFYVSRETHHKKTESVTVVFLDRLAGLIAVLLIATCSILATLYIDDTFRFVLPYFSGFIFILFLFVIFIFTKGFWKRYIPIDKILSYKFFNNKIINFLIRTISKVIGALYTYRKHKTTAFIALIESIILQLIMCCFAWSIGAGLGFGISGYIYFIVFPAATLILALPITPGGLGVGDGALIGGFLKFGVNENLGTAFVVLYRFNTLLMSIPGLFLWLLPETHISRKELKKSAKQFET